MDDQITVGDLVLLVSVFVGPFLLAAGFAQLILLRQAGMRIGAVVGVLLAAALVTLLLTWGLLYVVPFGGTGRLGRVFVVPAIIAATAVTVCVGLYARRRRPAA